MHPDAGTIRLEGQPVLIHDVQHAMRPRLNLVPKFSGLQNLVLGSPNARRLGVVDWAAARRSVEPVAAQMGIHFSLDLPAKSLTVAQQWLLSITCTLTLKSRLIAMDEPTASLSTEEVEHLFSVIRELSSQGIAVIYVTHRLHQIEAICQRVTVFKDGERVALMEREQQIERHWQRCWDHSIFCIGQVGLRASRKSFTSVCYMTKLRHVHWIEEGFHIGYFEDYPDYRTQGKTLEELQDNLRDLFQDISSGNIPYETS